MFSVIKAAEHGLTREEISQKLGIPIQSVCPAVKSLLDAERIFYKPASEGRPLITRPTVSGKPAYVCFAR